jgi:hypothetical protein
MPVRTQVRIRRCQALVRGIELTGITQICFLEEKTRPQVSPPSAWNKAKSGVESRRLSIVG